MTGGHCEADPSLERTRIGSFAFPLGSYPIEAMEPKPGYSVDFESADGGDEEGEWEEWPDRYVFDAVVSAERVEALVRTLLSLMPARVYPILDYLGHDAYREVDPYISYELIGLDRMLDALRRFRDFFFEDGLCGFGAMIDDPFFYVFVDEHKIVTVRAETALKERVERVLAAFDLEPVEEPAGADAVAHEHRGVLLAPDDRPDLMNPDEIVERLMDEWRLVLNVDPERNVDDEGQELGRTLWRCLIRVSREGDEAPRYAEALVSADCLREADELAESAAESLLPEGVAAWDELVIIGSDRVSAEDFRAALGGLTGGAPGPEGPAGAAGEAGAASPEVPDEAALLGESRVWGKHFLS